MKVGYIGNFIPEHSTENDVGRALKSHGVEVVGLQENNPTVWENLPATAEHLDFILWTHTWSFDVPIAAAALDAVRARGTKVVGYHLDRVWGLEREREITRHPFYTHVDLLVTADGGHEREWADAGIDHRWLAPAVSLRSCYLAETDRASFPHPVVFVGSWKSYHPEWGWRSRMVTELRRRYKRTGEFGVYPTGGQALRGHGLNVLYATADVVVGDSCLAGGAVRYWSDRVPETLGRGGILVHPWVEGLDLCYSGGGRVGSLWTYSVEDMDQLLGTIDIAREMAPDHQAHCRRVGIEWALDGNTYEDRMVDLLRFVEEIGVRKRARSFGVSAVFEPRPDTTDQIVIDETWVENVYRLDPEWVKDGVVVDVGANIGAVSVWAALHGARRVIAVEPEPGNVAQLEANLAANGLDGLVDVVVGAVYGKWGKERFAVLDGDSGGTKVAGWWPATDEACPEGCAPGVAFHKLFDRVTMTTNLHEIALLKIDIEGGEWEILGEPGNARLIGQRVQRMVVEFHNFGEGFSVGAFGRVVGLLAEVGKVQILGRPSMGGTIWWEAYR